MDSKLSVPFEEELTREAGWIHLDKYLYAAVRLHLHVEQTQTGELAFGDILRTYHTTPHSETEITQTFEEEFTSVDLRETTRSAALANNLIRKLTTTIGGAVKPPFYEITSAIGASLEQTVHASVGESIRASETVSRRERRTFTISQKINSGTSELQYAVGGYRRYSQSVFLHYIDYLFVEYRTTTFGLRKRKRNLPRPADGYHINRIPINIPLFKLLYWKFEPESSLIYSETEYQNLPRVAHPDRVVFAELHETIRLSLPAREEQPTLYTLSNIAFPLRWVDRKGPWTREELEQIELEEAEGSAWWYRDGPGRGNQR